MTQGSYNQFCPVAMAAEILCPRWTIVVLRELIAGSTRFNDLRRGVPRMSPALLSQRLKDLEAADIVRRTALPKEPAVFEYQLTPRGRELRPLIEAFGVWGHRWVESELSLQKLDVTLLMWDMRRNLDPSPMPPRHSVIQFCYSELPSAQRSWWLLVDPNDGRRPLFHRSRLRRRPLRRHRPAHHDRHLDGLRHRPRRRRRPAHAPHRRPLPRRQHANLASPLPLRPRTQTRELSGTGPAMDHRFWCREARSFSTVPSMLPNALRQS